MSEQQALPPNGRDQPFPEGTPVYDLNGEQVGTMSEHGLAGNVLILHKGLFFQRDLHVPLSSVQRSDPQGIFLSVSKEELQHERYDAPPATRASDEDRLISQGVDVIERHPDTLTKGEDTIEPTPDTLAKGTKTESEQ